MNCLTARLCAASLVLVAFASNSRANEYSEIVAFGASLTDSGNVYVRSPGILGFNYPVSPPNYQGRFSNGPSWLDNLADRLGLDRPVASEADGNNYAWSGATTGAVEGIFKDLGIIDMDGQVAEYLRDRTVSGDELFVIPGWTSLNDFDARHEQPATPANAARFVGQMINDLASAGADNFFLPLGMTTQRRAQHAGTMVSYNSHLLDELNSVQQSHPNVSIKTFNVQPTIDLFYSDPTSFGFRFLNGNACTDCTPDNRNPVEIVDNPNEYLFWEGGHFTAPANAAIGRAAFERLTSPDLIYEDFDYLPLGGLPHNTTFLDTSRGRNWGPGRITHEDGKLRFQTAGEVPPKDPVSRLETGLMVLAWDESSSHPSFANGYLRTTLRADTLSNANVALRGDLEQLTGYIFRGNGTSGRFSVHCFCDEIGQLGEIPGQAFEVGVDYHMEVGAVGDRLTMKAWPVGENEPALPQLVLFDDRLSEGAIALAPAVSPAALTRPTRVDVSYDSISFRPSALGDINQDSLVDVRDVDQLNSAIADANQHPYFDLNRDGSVDVEDRRTWVQDEAFAHTYFGDANLDGEFNTNDLVSIFQVGQYEDAIEGNATWETGDWNGDGDFGTADLVFAFQDGGFEQGPRVALQNVPEPPASLLILTAMFSLRNKRR